MSAVLNIASTLTQTAARDPDGRAVVVPERRERPGKVIHSEISFRQLDELSDRLAAGLQQQGISPGTRIVLMVRPGIEFIALTYALFKAGAVVVLIDPGMGPRRVFRCLDQVEPEGFVAIPPVQALRTLSPGRFPQARCNVTVGRRWFWSGTTYDQLRQTELRSEGREFQTVATRSTDPAAIIFTSGSTGPAKGVVYEHGMFAAQVEALRDFYGIEPGGVDLPGFPLFALFNAAMGVTTVVPDMDPTRPALVDPERFLPAFTDQHVTQAFGSPAIWKRVSGYCAERQIKLPTVRRIFLAGAPVPVEVLATLRGVLTSPGAELFTPYGATEALPVCSISASDVLARTAEATRRGAGTCVGRPLPGIQLKIIERTDEPICSIEHARELPAGEVGEIVVRGPVVTREYFRDAAATARAKIADGENFWHRMGDVGYLDAAGALWFCGRKSHVVETGPGPMYTDCVEPIINTHSWVARCALVGIGSKPHQTPVVVIELKPGATAIPTEELRELAAAHDNTRPIRHFLTYRGSLPVDVRHNIKINREQLGQWAGDRIRIV